MDSICLGQYQLYTSWICPFMGIQAGDTEAIWVCALLCLQMKKINWWANYLGSQKCTCAQFTCRRSIMLANAEIASYPMRSTWYKEILIHPSCALQMMIQWLLCYIHYISTKLHLKPCWVTHQWASTLATSILYCDLEALEHYFMFVDPHVKSRVHLWNFNSQFKTADTTANKFEACL